jgi:spermidine synthase
MEAVESAAPAARSSVAPAFALLALCFFLSGATGLVYQVVWLRMLGLVFGHTVYATTTVLVAFMAGLGLGSWLLARRAAKLRNLVAIYGWLELGIGIYCALLPLLFAGAATIYFHLHRSLGLSYDTFSLVQFGLIAAILVVPTTLMGGTLPVLSQALAREEVGLGRTIGALYAVNTFGAVAGVALAGYVLLPRLGNHRTLGLAAIANLAVGAIALAYSRRRRDALDPPAAAPVPDRRATRHPEAWLAASALALSGAVSMIYEVAWTRAMSLMLGSSTYAFSSMLLAFLIGIAGGSALYSLIWGNRHASLRTFATLQAGIAGGSVFSVFLYERLPELFLQGLAQSDSPTSIQTVQVLLSAASLLPATLFIGATFPCAVAVAARHARHAGEDVGHVYALNTLGAIVGSVMGGLVLIPVLGVHASMRLAMVTNLVVAAGLCILPLGVVPLWRWAGFAAALTASVGAWYLPTWQPDLLASGVAVYGKSYLRDGWAAATTRWKDQKVVFFRDGISATVSVHWERNELFLRVNGKTDASTSGDLPTQLMTGHIPMLLHPDPRSVLVIGLGSGITAGAAAIYPLERLDVVELEPAVCEAARFFDAHNGKILDDPRLRLWQADGRNYLLTTPERYDVIVSEPSNPWIGGLASFFTVELFHHARARLKPGGLFVQWLQGYSLEADDFRMIMRTFQSVFPDAQVWNTVTGDYVLIGMLEHQPMDLRRLKARVERTPGVRESLLRIGIRSWPGTLAFFMLDAPGMERLSGTGPVNTDDRLTLEFTAPRALYLNSADWNWRLTTAARRTPLPPIAANSAQLLDEPAVRHDFALMLSRRQLSDDALEQLRRALELDPRHVRSLLASSAVSLSNGKAAQALTFAKRALEVDPRSARGFYLAGMAYGRMLDREQARLHLERAAALAPDDGQIRRALVRAQVADLGSGAFGGDVDYPGDVMLR